MIQTVIAYLLFVVMQLILLWRGIWGILDIPLKSSLTSMTLFAATNPYMYRWYIIFLAASVFFLLLPLVLMFVPPARKRRRQLHSMLKGYRTSRAYLLVRSALWCLVLYQICFIAAAFSCVPFIWIRLRPLVTSMFIIGGIATMVCLGAGVFFLWYTLRLHPARKRYDEKAYQSMALLYGPGAEKASSCSDLLELADKTNKNGFRLFDASLELDALAELIKSPVPEVLDNIRIHIFLLDTGTPEETLRASIMHLEELRVAGRYRLDVQVLFIVNTEAALPIRSNLPTDGSYHVIRRPSARNLRLLCTRQCHWAADQDIPDDYLDPRELVLNFPELVSDYRYLSQASPYLFEFLHYGMIAPSQQQSVMALFDYIDLLLRVMSYTAYFCRADVQTTEKNPETILLKHTYNNLAENLVRYTPQEAMDRLFMRFRIDHLSCFNAMQQIFELRFDDNCIDFWGIVSLLQYVRNKTRGHGVLQAENLPHVWSFAAYSALWLSCMLRIADFRIQIIDSQVMCGYKDDDLVSLNRFAFVRNGHPCLAFQVFKEQIEYIDYFEGEFIRPEFVQSPQ